MEDNFCKENTLTDVLLLLYFLMNSHFDKVEIDNGDGLMHRHMEIKMLKFGVFRPGKSHGNS